MNPTSLKLPARSDKHIDYDNYCRLIQAVQELLTTQYDGNFFETRQTSGGLVVSGKRPEHGKDSFDLVWNTRNNVTVKKGLVWCPFQTSIESPGEVQVTLVQSDETELNLPDLGQYLTIYASAEVGVGFDMEGPYGVKNISSIGISACDSESAGEWKVPRDATVALPPLDTGSSPVAAVFFIPLYATSAQVGDSVGNWDHYILVHDFRYAPRFTFDVQGWQKQSAFAPLPQTAGNLNDLLEIAVIETGTAPLYTGWIPPAW